MPRLTFSWLDATLDERISDHPFRAVTAGDVVDHVAHCLHAARAWTRVHALEVAAAGLVARTVLVQEALGAAADVRVAKVALDAFAHSNRITLLTVGIGATRRRVARVHPHRCCWSRRC